MGVFLRPKQNSIQRGWNDNKIIADITQIGGLDLLVKFVPKTVIIFAYLSGPFWNSVFLWFKTREMKHISTPLNNRLIMYHFKLL